MEIRTVTHPKFVTRDGDGEVNGFLVPLFNEHDGFFAEGKEPRQVYLTTVLPGKIKGPHLHFVRTGFFTCIKGNVRVVLRVDGDYVVFLSGESHEYRSIEIPTGVPAAVQCLGDEEALVLNMPNPAWTAEMNDEHSADFEDFDFNQ
ncbi:MAG: WxcM-like domain-containing protein [Acidobacteria bacterium]|nr:WxcM-like domain-containing protein [Acidobacteriota bacterium]